MDIISNCKAAIAGRGLKVVLPETSDDRIMRAAIELRDQGLAVPVLVGERLDLEPRWAASLRGIEFSAFASDPDAEFLASVIMQSRPSLSEKAAARLLAKPLYYAGALVASGRADAFVAGAANPTRRVIEAGLMTVGLSPNIETPSSYFVMLVPASAAKPARTLIFADCAVNVEPNARELADIAIASGASARSLGIDPRIALLSFSTKGSAQHCRVDKVCAALAHVRKLVPEVAIDGELQGDAALSAIVAAKKMREPGAIFGNANVLIFPDLDAGNIAYKLVQELAGAQAIGPFLQGFARPISDLSRGATVDDIVAAVVVTLARVPVGR